jgi:hypothetical protein
MTGADLIRWTIWLATAAYFGRWICQWFPAHATEQARLRRARLCWTAACALLWIHVACAFQFYHHWSHVHAVAHGAEQTRRVVGFEFGEGIWTNYVTMGLWLVDVVWWWVNPQSFAVRPRWLNVTWQSYLAFIGFNATVAFAGGFVRWGTLAMMTLIIISLMISRRRLKKTAVPPPFSHDS